MSFPGTCVVYLLIGLAVGVALLLRSEEHSLLNQLSVALGGVLFWPFFAPLLLAGPAIPMDARRSRAPGGSHFAAVQQSLLTAMSGLKGVAEEVLAPELARVRGLADSVTAMEHRLEEMSRLLDTPEFDGKAAAAALEGLVARGLGDQDPRVQSVKARLRNIDRLQSMRTRTSDDIERVVLKLEELSSQLRLLAFAGRVDADIVRVIKEIAESVSDVTEGLLADEVPVAIG